MNHEELFVGAVSITLGLAGIVAAIGNRDSYYKLDKVRWLETVWGRRTVRLVYGFVGLVLIVLGVAIALGFGPNKTAEQGSPRQRHWILSKRTLGEAQRCGVCPAVCRIAC